MAMEQMEQMVLLAVSNRVENNLSFKRECVVGMI